MNSKSYLFRKTIFFFYHIGTRIIKKFYGAYINNQKEVFKVH